MTSIDKRSEKTADVPERAPYANDTKEPVAHHGRCYCGKVTFTLHRKMPLASKYCHCKTCQRLHGAVFQWAVIFHKEDVKFHSGQSLLRFFYHSPDNYEWAYKLPCKVSTDCCGTYIMDEGRSVLLLFPGIIDLNPKERLAWRTEKGESGKRPCHIFYEERVIDVKDGLKKWRGLDEKSELMEDEDEKGMEEAEKQQSEKAKDLLSHREQGDRANEAKGKEDVGVV